MVTQINFEGLKHLTLWKTFQLCTSYILMLHLYLFMDLCLVRHLPQARNNLYTRSGRIFSSDAEAAGRRCRCRWNEPLKWEDLNWCYYCHRMPFKTISRENRHRPEAPEYVPGRHNTQVDKLIAPSLFKTTILEHVASELAATTSKKPIFKSVIGMHTAKPSVEEYVPAAQLLHTALLIAPESIVISESPLAERNNNQKKIFE